MPKKKKSKLPGYGSDHVSGDVIRNQFVSGDGSNPVESLKQLQEIFRGKVDSDVVQLVFSECGFNVEQALESLFTLTTENEKSETLCASGLPLYSEIRPNTLYNCEQNISMKSAYSIPLQPSKSFSTSNNINKRLSDFATSRSSWQGISNSSDSSTNDSDFSNPVSRRNSHDLRHRYVADVICHKTDTICSNKKLDEPSRMLILSNKYENIPHNRPILGPTSNNVVKTSNSTNDYETIYPLSKAQLTNDGVNLPVNPFVEAITLINQNKKIMIILRGLPGSGKTSLAKNLVHNGIILSTDDYFCQNGKYFFEPSKLPEAHNWNKDRTLAALKDGVSPIIIDNTNTQSWEMLPYVSLGIRNNFLVKILEPETSWKFKVSELARRNQHNVPKESIAKMLERYEHGLTVDDVMNRKHPKYASIPLSENSLTQPTNSNLLIDNPLISEDNNVNSVVDGSPMRNVESSENEMLGTKSKSVSVTSIMAAAPDSQSVSSASVRLDLEDLMALVQLDSEDSQSASRRTSASSSHDASGWECDEEFMWTNDEAQAIAKTYGHYLRGDIPEGNESAELNFDVVQTRDSSISDLEKLPTIDMENSSEKIKEWLSKDCVEKSEIFPVPDNSACELIKDIITDTNTEDNSFTSKKNKKDKNNSEWEVLEVGDWSSSSDVLEESHDPKPQRKRKNSRGSTAKVFSNEENARKTISIDNDSQTVPEDFALLQKASLSIQMTNNSLIVLKANPIIATPKVNLEYSTNFIRQPVMFDKSTLTDHFEELEKEGKISLLSSMFPSVTQNDLEYILDKCFGDHNWAINSLLDFGHEYNNPNVKPPTFELLVKEEIKDSVAEVMENFDCDGEIKSPSSPETTPTSGSDEGIGTDTEASKPSPSKFKTSSDPNNVTLILSLDPIFAMQLEEMFGPVIQNSGIDEPNSKKLNICLDIEGARTIHNLWKKSFFKDKLHDSVPSLNSQNNSSSKNDVMFLKDIMALELEMSKKREEIEKHRMANGEDLATRMKRQKLYNLFPGVDPTALDDIFDSNNYSLPQSLALLEEILGHGPNGSPLFSADVAKQAEDELMEQALEESRQELGFMEDDWLSWVAVEDFEDPELKKLQKNLFTNTGYNELRMEANTYHQLRMECFKKGQEAYNRGMKTVASFYSQQGHMHTQKLKEANRRAANKILEIRNAHNDPNVLDLHGLHRDEAIIALNSFISNKKEELKSSQLNKLVLFVITGRGIHSTNNQPKVKPVVEDFLIRGQFRYESVHDGLFKVIIS